MFIQRLTDYRSELGLNQKEMAAKLNVKDAYYSMIEGGKRSPSKSFLQSLVALSSKPEEYWLYGVNDETYVIIRDDFKCTATAVEQLLNLKMDLKDLFEKSENGDIVIKKNSIEELLVAALEADIEHLILKQNIKEQ